MSLTYPKISLVTPAFNCRDFIEATLQSVLGQQYPNLEYIVMDGGSTDGTAQVIERYANQLAYWQSQPDAGQYDAINQGLSRATGEILCWLNADDMLLPRSLFVVGEIFTQLPEVKWISSLQPATWDANGNLAHVDTTPGFSQQAFLDGLYLPTTAKKGYWLQQESTFWRRSLWDQVGARIPNDDLAGDFALWCQFYRHAQLYGTPYPLGGFRMLEGQRSEDYEGYMTQASRALADLRKHHAWNPNTTSSFIYGELAHIPVVKPLMLSRYGYQGNCIQKVNPRSPNSAWQIIQHAFLP